MKKMIRAVAFMLAALLVFCASSGALAAKKSPKLPQIIGHPKKVTVTEGGECRFNVQANGQTGITWHFYDPATKKDILASKIGEIAPDMKVQGKNNLQLHLKNIPLALNGWEVYCLLGNKAGNVVTAHATLTVTPRDGTAAPAAEPTAVPATEAPTAVPTEAPTAAPTEAPVIVPTEAPTEAPAAELSPAATAEPTPAPTEEPATEAETEPATEADTEPATDADEDPIPEEEPEAEPSLPQPAATIPPVAEGEKIVAVTGGYLNNNEALTYLVFTDKASVLITANVPAGKTLQYWRINGVRVDFPSSVYRFSLSDLDRTLTIEAVYR